MLIHEEGGMSVNDLQELIERRIPDGRAELEKSHLNLAKVADFCEENYINSHNRAQALVDTKRYAIQSLASVAYQINKMAVDLKDMLALQTDNVSSLTNKVQYVNQIVDIHKEKMARREIGALTNNKQPYKQPKIIAPAIQEQKTKYQRIAIDYSVLDAIGHGVRVPDQSRATLVSRASSSISGNSPSQFNNESPAYGVFSGERTATLGRSMRSYAPSIAPSDYRPPQVSSQSDSRMTRQISHGSEYGDHISRGGGGSQYGSSDYNTSYNTDVYGTLRAPGRINSDGGSTIPVGRLSSGQSSAGGPESPTYPLPPSQLSSRTYTGYVPPGSMVQQHNYGTLRQSTIDRNDLPPPPPQTSMLSGMPSGIDSVDDIDDLPPPPESVGGSSAYGIFSGVRAEPISSSNLFDVSSDWVPSGEYIEKARVLYDYEAQKADELTLRENAIVFVVRKNEDGWYEGVLDGVTGLFPGNYVEKL